MKFYNIEDKKYRRLLQNQYVCIKSDASQIKKTAKKLHTLIFTDDSELSDHDKRVKQRCCELPLLEPRICEYYEAAWQPKKPCVSQPHP